MLIQKLTTKHADNKTYKNGESISPYMQVLAEDSLVDDADLWEEVRRLLTKNQWKWVKYFIIEDMPLKEIAEQEGVTTDAVKSWGREVRKKLMREGIGELVSRDEDLFGS
ncbi:hypothetical protein [Oceanobacillus sp. CF4.6]|uniref:hypothetical protein n=1 Tax=Oceanobacillus sp. CF4.6 TaxID=3373080 RepID=UPI003EE7F6A9